MVNKLVEFYIPAGTYRTGIRFVFGKDKASAIKLINKGQLADYTEANLDVSGCVFRKEGYHPIIWMPDFPTTPDNFGTFSHEILHGVKWILLNWAGMPLGDDSEEAYCHLQSHFTREALTKIMSIKRKSRRKTKMIK